VRDVVGHDSFARWVRAGFEDARRAQRPVERGDGVVIGRPRTAKEWAEYITRRREDVKALKDALAAHPEASEAEKCEMFRVRGFHTRRTLEASIGVRLPGGVIS
jgi:hypothetical protein